MLAIVRDPSVFLFDEPLSNLDAALRMSTRQEIAALHAQLGTTMIYVTHDQVEAMTLADKIVVLKDGQVMQAGAPLDLYHHPANRFVAGFLGAPSMNFLDVRIDAIRGDMAAVSGNMLNAVQLPVAGKQFVEAQAATLGIRPQHLRSISPGTGTFNGTVHLLERLGSETIIEVKLDCGATLIAALPEDTDLIVGCKVSFDFDPQQAHLFQ